MFAKISKSLLQIILLVLLVLIIIAIVIGGMLGLSFVKIAKGAPDINPESMLLELAENSKILDKDGNIIEEIASEEYRDVIEYSKIPKHVRDAIISIEDERFWTNNGVDIKGVVKSTIDNLVAGDIVRGGSTITQQLVKNIYLSPDIKWERKVVEMYLALRVNDEIPKEKILEAYLNRVYFGQHAYGIQAASQIYFSKDVSELTVAQAATLAGIVKSPSTLSLFYSYYPGQVPKGAKVLGDFYVAGENFKAVLNEGGFKRKNDVLAKMKELGSINEEQYQQALKEDVTKSVKPGSKRQKDYSNHIADLIKKDALRIIIEKKEISKEEAYVLLYSGGLNIKTTIDWDMQKKLEEAYEDFPKTMGKYSPGKEALLSDFKYDGNRNILNSDNRAVYFYKGNFFSKEMDLRIPKKNYSIAKNGDIQFETERITSDGKNVFVSKFYDIDDNKNMVTYRSGSLQIPTDAIKDVSGYKLTIKNEFLKENTDFYKVAKDKSLLISKNYFTPETKGTLQPQSATVIIDQKTGYIKALVGARGESSDDTIDRATNFARQPASSIKPLAVYSPALENGYTLASVVDDAPMKDVKNNIVWPLNVYKGFKGLTSVRDALIKSVNTVAVKIYNDIGTETSMEYLRGFGLINADNPSNDNFISKAENPDINDENPSTAIGSVTRGFTVKDMASAYTALANEGVRNETNIIMSIESKKDGKIYDDEAKQTRVLNSETAWLITDVLNETYEKNIEKIGRINSKVEIAAKTGTSNDNRDFWVAGYNPYYTAVTWLGFDDGSLSLRGSSHNLLTFYNDYNSRLLDGMKEAKFKKPSTIVEAEIDAQSGMLPNDYTEKDPRGNMVKKEFFAPNTVPTEISKAHILVKIDSRNNLLAGSYTPSNLAVNKVFIKREVPFNLNDFEGVELPEKWTEEDLIPEDVEYEAPTKYSDLRFSPFTQRTRYPDGRYVVNSRDAYGKVTTVTYYPNGDVFTAVRTPDGKLTTSMKRAATPEPAPEDPAPENPAPENPAPENPAPENPAPENPAPENPPPVDNPPNP